MVVLPICFSTHQSLSEKGSTTAGPFTEKDNNYLDRVASKSPLKVHPFLSNTYF